MPPGSFHNLDCSWRTDDVASPALIKVRDVVIEKRKSVIRKYQQYAILLHIIRDIARSKSSQLPSLPYIPMMDLYACPPLDILKRFYTHLIELEDYADYEIIQLEEIVETMRHEPSPDPRWMIADRLGIKLDSTGDFGPKIVSMNPRNHQQPNSPKEAGDRATTTSNTTSPGPSGLTAAEKESFTGSPKG